MDLQGGTDYPDVEMGVAFIFQDQLDVGFSK